MPTKKKTNQKMENCETRAMNFVVQDLKPDDVYEIPDASITSLNNEIKLMRTVIQRFYDITDKNSVNLDEWGKVVGTLGMAATRLARLIETHHKLEGNSSGAEQLRKALVEMLEEIDADIQPFDGEKE
jgi:CRISPR/Cas system CSM-associated protein Csm2 small subunit